MSPDEAVKLIAIARAAYPGMSVVEGMGHLWHGGLGDLRFQECATAIVEHSKESTAIVMIADIRRLVNLSRRQAAGEERQQQIEAHRPPSSSQELVQMPDWFWPTVNEHKRRAKAAQKQAEEAGQPISFGDAIVLAVDRQPRGPRPGQWS